MRSGGNNSDYYPESRISIFVPKNQIKGRGLSPGPRATGWLAPLLLLRQRIFTGAKQLS